MSTNDSSNFVIGSDDDEPIQQDVDSQQVYDTISDSNCNPAEQHNPLLDSYQQTQSATKGQQTQNSHERSPSSSSSFRGGVATDSEAEFKYKPLSRIIDTSDFFRFQKFSHTIIYPLMHVCDHRVLRERAWLQIPLIKYTICITSMIIGISMSQLIIKAYELKAAEITGTSEHYDLNDVIYFLVAYVILISTLSLCFLYLYYQYHSEHGYYSFSLYHYNYFVMTCSGIIGYAILYLLIHIQSQFYSSSIGASISCLTGAAVFAISCLGVIILIKQFLMDFRFTYNSLEDEYETDEDRAHFEEEHNPLLNDDDSSYYQVTSSPSANITSDDNHDQQTEARVVDNNEFKIDNHIDDDERILNEYKEKGVFWFTITCLSMDIWHISIGLIMIECVVYMFVGKYVNLLIDWTHNESTVIGNIWNIIVFGFLLAFITGIAQIALQIYCKSPLYQYQLELTAMNEYQRDYTSFSAPISLRETDSASSRALSAYLATLPHKEDIILFLLAWLNDISYLWNRILAAAIGWSLLTPNQTHRTLTQFVTAITGTALFLGVGYIFNDYKRRIQKDILAEIRDIKQQLKSNGGDDIEHDGELMKMIVYDKQKLVFYDQLHATYDLAFAVSVSYSWESFLVIALGDVLGTHPLNRFIAHLLLTVFIAVVFSQLGLELVDLKRQRVKEAKNRKQKRQRVKQEAKKKSKQRQKENAYNDSGNVGQRLLDAP